MGLDVTHIQLTLTPNNAGHFFALEEWDLDFNVPLQHYSKYITTIDDLDYDKNIAIVKNEMEYDKIKKSEWFKESEYLKIFVGEFNDKMRKQLNKFIENEKLDKLENTQLGCNHDGIEYHTISFATPIKVQGIYYVNDIGYQRKGMNKHFHDTFKEYMFWGKKEDFDLAYTCVGDEWYIAHFGEDAVEKMRRNFKENFVDKFEFGKSLLRASF